MTNKRVICYSALPTLLIAALMGLDVPVDRVHMESFGGAEAQDTSVTDIAATAQITLNGTAFPSPPIKLFWTPPARPV
ncbi:MAG: hypothetical protein ABJG14_03265 [Sulfitobacter sp.]|uniref:hypothetical protein n=1 Tax=Alphaproteobacteria TaxID=28211 RepID=UPI0032638861